MTLRLDYVVRTGAYLESGDACERSGCSRQAEGWCSRPDLNWHALFRASDFKSDVSTDFTTGAWYRYLRNALCRQTGSRPEKSALK